MLLYDRYDCLQGESTMFDVVIANACVIIVYVLRNEVREHFSSSV